MRLLYFSHADQFNDPFDCAPVCTLAKHIDDPEFVAELQADEARMIAESGLSEAEVAALRKSEGVPVEKMAAAVTANIRSLLRDDTRVFCLSQRQDHPLLWSHYADSHRGICVHFRCKYGSLFGLARAVEYKRERLPILIPLKYNISDDDIADAMVRNKADFWGYEHEFRIIAHNAADWGYTLDGRYCSFDGRLLVGITLGSKISAEHRAMVKGWAGGRAPPIPVYQAAESGDTYSIDIDRVT